MDREKIIGRIRGPFPDGSLTWKFEGHRRPKHSLKTFVGRRYVLKYDPATRAFKVRCYRRLSKRNKKEAVASAKAMIPFLKARLTGADLARCTAASILRPLSLQASSKSTTVLQGAKLYMHGAEFDVTDVNVPTLP